MKNILFVLVVVPDGHGRYLVVCERDGSFYLPAGKVEKAENLMAAAVRETAEEAGVAIGLRGILGIDHGWHGAHGKLRFCFVGFQAIIGATKRHADHHSRGAMFATVEEIERLPLRHPEVLDWIKRYERSEVLLPCDAYDWSGPRGPSFSAVLG